MAVCCSMQYNWKIHGFSNLNSNTGFRIDSEFLNNGDLKSRIGLCPNGNVEQNRGYLSVYLWMGCPIPYDATILFDIQGSDGQYRHSKRREVVVPADCREGWGFDQFISRSFIMDPSNGLLNNGMLIIRCTVVAAPCCLALKSNLNAISKATANNNSDCVNIGRDNHGIIINAREFHLHYHGS